MKPVRVAADRWNFKTSDGAFITPLDGKRQVRDRATTPLTFSLLGLYTCRAYQDRMWDEFHAAIQAGQVPAVRFI